MDVLSHPLTALALGAADGALKLTRRKLDCPCMGTLPDPMTGAPPLTPPAR